MPPPQEFISTYNEDLQRWLTFPAIATFCENLFWIGYISVEQGGVYVFNLLASVVVYMYF